MLGMFQLSHKSLSDLCQTLNATLHAIDNFPLPLVYFLSNNVFGKLQQDIIFK